MRQWFFITLILTTSLVACHDSETSKSPSAMTSPSPSPTTNANTDSRGFLANTTYNQQLQEQHPLEYNCTMDLCADTFNKFPIVSKLTELAATPTDEQKNYYNTYIVPALAKNNELLRTQAKQWYDLLSAKDSQFPTVTLTSDQLRVLHTMNILKNAEKNSAVAKYWNSTFANMDFVKASATFRVLKKWTYLQELYPKLSLQDAQSAELKLAEDILGRLGQIIQGVDEIDPLMSAKIKAGQLLTNSEVEDFSEFAFTVRILNHFLFEKAGADLITAQMKNHTYTSDELYKIYLEKDPKGSLLKRSQQDPKNNCEESYYQSINLYPSQAQLESFKNLAEQTRETALSLLSPQDPAFERLKNVKILYPLNAAENSKAWLVSLEAKNRTLQRDIDAVGTFDMPSIFAISMIRAMFSGNDVDYKQCPRIPDSTISDQTLPTSGYIQLSWYSIKYPAMGTGILAHEMGHSVFAYSNAYDSAKSCLSEKQNSEQYTNEDFADLFSTKVTSTMAKKYGTRTANFGCGLMDQVQGLSNLTATDPHSSDLYRALQITINTGQAVPASCQQLANRDQTMALRVCQ